jgi:hypothetical protein
MASEPTAQIANESRTEGIGSDGESRQVRLSLRMRPKRGSREVVYADRADADRAGVLSD